MNKRVIDVAKMSIVTALYITVTLVFSVISFGAIQVRIAEMFNLLVLYDKKYIPAITLGVLLVNFASPLGPIDVIVGTLETFLAITTMYFLGKKIKNHNSKLIMGVIVSSLYMFIIAIELVIVYEVPFWITYGYLIIGEAISLTIGVIILKALEKRIKLEEYL